MAATKKRKAEVQLEAERPISQPRPTPMERGFGKWAAASEDAYHLDLGDGASILYLKGLFSASECKRLQQVLLTDLQVITAIVDVWQGSAPHHVTDQLSSAKRALQEGEESSKTRGFKEREVKVWNKCDMRCAK